MAMLKRAFPVALALAYSWRSALAQFEGMDKSTVAKVCAKILETANDGQVESWETQPGYHSALNTCTKIFLTPEELQRFGDPQRFGNQSIHFDEQTVDAGCARLATEAGRQQTGGPEGDWIQKAFNMCKSFAGNIRQEAVAVVSQKMQEFNEMDGHAIAKGCKQLLAAKDNGQIEWFENEGWYQEAIKTCESIADTTEDLNVALENQGKQLLQQMQGTPADTFAKTMCERMQKAKENGKVEMLREQPWYAQAAHLCSMLESVTVEQLHAEEKEPESMAGIAMRRTCERFWKTHQHNQRHHHQRSADAEDEEDSDWYRSTLHMCSKLEQDYAHGQGMSGEDLVEKCKLYNGMKLDSHAANVERPSMTRTRLPVLTRLSKMCGWLARAQDRFHAGKFARGPPKPQSMPPMAPPEDDVAAPSARATPAMPAMPMMPGMKFRHGGVVHV